MPIYEWSTFRIGCGGKGCSAIAASGGDEKIAEMYAKAVGFEQVGSEWYCHRCAPKAKCAAKKARSR